MASEISLEETAKLSVQMSGHRTVGIPNVSDNQGESATIPASQVSLGDTGGHDCCSEKCSTLATTASVS